MNFRTFLLPLALGAALIFSACSPGDSTSSGGGSSGSVAEGGISGTGEGTVTGFGSIIINDTRHFEVVTETQLFLDGETTTQQALEDKGAGLVARVDVGEDVNDDFSAGTAVNVFVEHLVKGPVTATSPVLEVLGQPVATTGDTVLDNLAAVGDLTAGDLLEVSGFAGPNGAIQASRLELKNTLPVWKLTGTVTALVAGTSLNIGSQAVSLVGVTPTDCGAGPAVDDLVEIKAADIPGFTAGDTLDTVTSLECLPDGLVIPEGATGDTLHAEVEGVVNAVTVLPDPGPAEFTVNGQQVVTTATTVYENGAAEDVQVGVNLEAEGDLDVASGILTAEKIRFRSNRVRIRAPLQDIVGGTTVQVLGLDILATPLTEDEDSLLTADPVPANQVEVRGFVDSTGQVYADRIRERDPDPDPTDVRLRGPVTAIPGAPELELLNILVDTSGATFLDQTGASIGSAAFFSAISAGSQVEVEGATFGAGSLTSLSSVEIED